jgi:hypothetical protein
MKHAKLLLASLLTLALTTVFIAAAPATSVPTAGFGTEVQIEPSAKTPSAFSIRVKVTSLSTGEVIAAPHLLLAADQTAEAKSDLPDGSTATVSARVDAGGHAATYSVALKKGDQVLSSHSAKVNLP